MGSLYKRGNTWWMKYSVNGKQIRESTKTTKKMIAKEILKKAEEKVVAGITPELTKAVFDDIAKLFIQDYRLNSKKNLKHAELYVKNLKSFFGKTKVTEITTNLIDDYIEMKIKKGYKNATVNRELSALKRMLNLGHQQTPPLVVNVPYIRKLAENNVRQGFFTYKEFLNLRENLPDYLQGYVTFAYKYGWRRAEIKNIKKSNLNKSDWSVRIDASETKNNTAKSVFLDKEMQGFIQKELEREKRKGIESQFLFSGKYGKGIDNYYHAWSTATKKTGLTGKKFHDLRRTAVRNMVRAGVNENTAMNISGHKTRSVFDRYDIINEEDLKNASMAIFQHQKNSLGTNLGTI